jgi:Ca-activated chloride channel family protein
MGAGPQIRRHIPPVLFLLALAAMLLAAARPVAVITLPSSQQTIILAMDVSGSMRATDVKPSRIAAAQEAARAFVAEQPRTTRIGVVSFAATASVVQSPHRRPHRCAPRCRPWRPKAPARHHHNRARRPNPSESSP